LFLDVLKWCISNNVIVTVDIKRSVSQEVVINAIREAHAEDVSVIITYDVKQAKTAYTLAPDLLLSVSARNDDEYTRLLAAQIPTKNMLAFTGTRLSDASLFERLHADDIVCMLGTLGNLDKQAEARGNALYLKWKEVGVDIFATDRPFEAYNAITN
jgi:glycerophosphoryl diester phosphodiesterase